MKPGLRRIGDLAAHHPTWALVGLLVLAGTVAGVGAPSVIRFRAVGVQEFAQLFVPAIAAALFIERVIEVLVSIARGDDARRLRVASEAAERRAGRREASREDRDAATMAREKRAAFQSETKYVTLVGGVALGLVLSVLGVRVLEHLVEVDVLPLAQPWQANGFRLFDVLLTGGLIGGGADGIHKLVSVFTTKFDQLSEANRRAQLRQEGS